MSDAANAIFNPILNSCYKRIRILVIISVFICLITLFINNYTDDIKLTVIKFFTNISDIDPEEVEDKTEDYFDLYESSLSLKDSANIGTSIIQIFASISLAYLYIIMIVKIYNGR